MPAAADRLEAVQAADAREMTRAADAKEMTMPEMGYAGRTVLVFGATGALGGGLAAAFAEAGASVAGADSRPPAPGRRLDGVRYHEVDALDDARRPVPRGTAAVGGDQHRGRLRATLPAGRPRPG